MAGHVINEVAITAPDDMEIGEIEHYLKEELKIWGRSGKKLGALEIIVEGKEVQLKSHEKSPIKRIRRITGYLSTIDSFNNAKQHELSDRKSHF
jgi:anaerobic ribonucleoside-triphosphate reductase activating protein